jgi:hypothetical protein
LKLFPNDAQMFLKWIKNKIFQFAAWKFSAWKMKPLKVTACLFLICSILGVPNDLFWIVPDDLGSGEPNDLGLNVPNDIDPVIL